MISILRYLESNWQRLDLGSFGSPSGLSCLVLTPRFRASRHVVFLILARGRPAPILVAKLPRRPEETESLEAEAAALRASQSARPGGFDSVPRVVACEPQWGTRLLIESALPGRPLDPGFVRRAPDRSLAAVRAWLIDLHAATMEAGPGREPAAEFDRLVARPLREFGESYPLSPEDRELLVLTEALVAPLREVRLPQVLAHGDLGHPNILVRPDGRIGVVDWELAEVAGLPALDLFFFLAYVAFARRKAREDAQVLAAFEASFFGPRASARPYVGEYARRLGLPEALLPALFVYCWARYAIRLTTRMNGGEGVRPSLPAEVLTWLRTNRYYQLWRYSVENFDRFFLVE